MDSMRANAKDKVGQYLLAQSGEVGGSDPADSADK